MIIKFIFLLALISFGAHAGTSSVLRELVTVGMRSLEGQTSLANVVTKFTPNYHLSRKSLAKSVSDHSRAHYALARAIEDPASEEVSREILVETLLGFSNKGYLVEKELLYELAKRVKPDQLQGIDLSGGNFENIDLSRVDLTRVNFADANLSGAVLSKAKLDGTSFVNANLYGAKVLGAKLFQVKLDGAKYDRATTLPSVMSFDPTEYGMVYIKRGRINWRESLFGEALGETFIYQCTLGASAGALSAAAYGIKLVEESKFYEPMVGGPVILTSAAIPLVFFSALRAHLGTAYICGAVAGAALGLSFPDYGGSD